MKYIRINELEQLKMCCIVFEEVIENYREERCRECLTEFSNKLHARMFSSPKAGTETSERVMKVLREVLKVGIRV